MLSRVEEAIIRGAVKEGGDGYYFTHCCLLKVNFALASNSWLQAGESSRVMLPPDGHAKRLKKAC